MKCLIGRLAEALTQRPGQYATAFGGLVSVAEHGMEAEDGGRRMGIPWSAVRGITASMGRQTYDMTPVLTIDHAVGRSVFLPSVAPLWPAFVTEMVVHLPGALPPDVWLRRLADDPAATIRIFRRLGLFG